VEQFFAAFSATELDLYALALQKTEQEHQQLHKAHQQQLQRLRYEAQLAERQFHRADPDNRLVTAELERRWEETLRALQEAEDVWRRQRAEPPVVATLEPQLRQALEQAGRQLPELWARADFFSQVQRKALLRCLIDKVVVQRSAPDTVQVRIVWRGGETTSAALPVTVGALARLSAAPQLEKEILQLTKRGKTDREIATLLTRAGHRSPKHATVLPSTVRSVRLRHRLLAKRSQSHPRHIPGFLTVTQVARQLRLTPHWIYDRIHKGTIQVTRDPQTNLFLFPDKPKTITLFQELRAAKLQKLRF